MPNAYINARPIALHCIEYLLNSSFVREVPEGLPFGPVVVQVRLTVDRVFTHGCRWTQLGINDTIRLVFRTLASK